MNLLYEQNKQQIFKKTGSHIAHVKKRKKANIMNLDSRKQNFHIRHLEKWSDQNSLKCYELLYYLFKKIGLTKKKVISVVL